jgi:hypothetical protein
VIEPADYRLAAKRGKFKLNGKVSVEMNVLRSVIVNLIGCMDSNGNCKVGLFEVRGLHLRSHLVTAVYKI